LNAQIIFYLSLLINKRKTKMPEREKREGKKPTEPGPKSN
jgi:hypothetical protein